MRNYKNGKIYVIRNHINEWVYVGSTTAPLYKRFSKHKGEINTKQKGHRKLYKAMREIGVEQFYIELIEEYPCENIEQLEAREGHWQREYNSYNNGYNGQIQGRSKKKWAQENKEKLEEQRKKNYEANRAQILQKHKEYYQENKEKLMEYQKEYREKNKEKVYTQRKAYREKNKDLIKEKKKEYHERNKERINEKSRKFYETNKERLKEKMKEYQEKRKEKLYEKVECECGSEVSRQHLKRHYTSKKHQDYLEQNK